MKRGDKVDCPACRNQTIVKEKVEMDGWTVGEKIFVCALCGAKLGDMNDAESSEQINQKAVSGLAALFDSELEEKPVMQENEGDRHFCKYCEHYIPHAFVERCDLHQREVTAMQSCPDFKQKKTTEKKDNETSDHKKPLF
jgi:hypothetical protein